MIAAMMLGAMLAPQTAAPPAEEKKICRRYPTLGSRVQGTRVCRTKAEWAIVDREAREDSTSAVERTRLRTLPGQ
jgi:hypothetical protein